MEGIRNGNRPCVKCGGPRDWTRVDCMGRTVAHPQCRKCHSNYNADWLYAKPERVAARHIYNLRPDVKAKVAASVKAWKARNPDKVREYERAKYLRIKRDGVR